MGDRWDVYLRRLRRIINAPAINASAFAPVEGSISGAAAGIAKQVPATPIPTKAIPAIFMIVLLNNGLSSKRELETFVEYDRQRHTCQLKSE